jgi:hypothetical protein
MASDPLASSSLSSSLASSGFDDESFINEVDGLPYVFLATIVETIDRAGKKRQLELTRRGGSRHGKRRNRNLGREDAARRLHADVFLGAEEVNPYGGTGPTFKGAEFERRLRINIRVYNEVKAGLLNFDPEFFEQ